MLSNAKIPFSQLTILPNIKMKKVAHVIYALNYGGAEVMLIDIVNIQIHMFEVHIFILNNSFSNELLKTINPKVKLHFLNRTSGSRNLIPLLRLNTRLIQVGPDVIHCHTENMANCLFFQKNQVLTVHDMGKQVKYFKKYKKLFSISKAVQNDVTSRSGLRSTLVYNGINFKKIKSKQFPAELSPFKVLQVSRLDSKKKGQDLLIKAVHALSSKHDISLDFIGEGSSLNELQALVTQYKMQDIVNFIGLKSREYIYENLHQYNALIQPSRFEGFGLTIIEAMAAKLPVVVSDIDGPREISKNGKFCCLFEKDNYLDLANAIERAINLYSNDGIVKYTDEAYNYAAENFCVVKTAEKYAQLYFD